MTVPQPGQTPATDYGQPAELELADLAGDASAREKGLAEAGRQREPGWQCSGVASKACCSVSGKASSAICDRSAASASDAREFQREHATITLSGIAEARIRRETVLVAVTERPRISGKGFEPKHSAIGCYAAIFAKCVE